MGFLPISHRGNGISGPSYGLFADISPRKRHFRTELWAFCRFLTAETAFPDRVMGFLPISHRGNRISGLSYGQFSSISESPLPRGNYSTFSSISDTIDPSTGELLDFLEHLGHDRPFRRRITRLSRASRARSTLPQANYSTFSSNSGTIDPSMGELLDFLE
jgi:hypothetical protein